MPALAALEFLDPEKILDWLGPWATIGLFCIVFAESGLLIGFFLPGDSLLFTAGLLAATAEKNNLDLNIGVLLAGCFAAAVAGDQVGYLFGRKVGPGLFRRPNSRLFKQEYVHRTKDFFEHHGPKTIILARFVPIVRTFAPILAGVGEMPYATFIRFNVVGGLLWAVGVTSLGYLLGEQVPGIEDYLTPAIFVIIFLSLIPPFLEWRKHRRSVAPATPVEAEREAEELEELFDDD
ncbi:MAG: DedA family protein [Actinomycetota bacterium]